MATTVFSDIPRNSMFANLVGFVQQCIRDHNVFLMVDDKGRNLLLEFQDAAGFSDALRRVHGANFDSPLIVESCMPWYYEKARQLCASVQAASRTSLLAHTSPRTWAFTVLGVHELATWVPPYAEKNSETRVDFLTIRFPPYTAWAQKAASNGNKFLQVYFDTTTGTVCLHIWLRTSEEDIPPLTEFVIEAYSNRDVAISNVGLQLRSTGLLTVNTTSWSNISDEPQFCPPEAFSVAFSDLITREASAAPTEFDWASQPAKKAKGNPSTPKDSGPPHSSPVRKGRSATLHDPRPAQRPRSLNGKRRRLAVVHPQSTDTVEPSSPQLRNTVTKSPRVTSVEPAPKLPSTAAKSPRVNSVETATKSTRVTSAEPAPKLPSTAAKSPRVTAVETATKTTRVTSAEPAPKPPSTTAKSRRVNSVETATKSTRVTSVEPAPKLPSTAAKSRRVTSMESVTKSTHVTSAEPAPKLPSTTAKSRRVTSVEPVPPPKLLANATPTTPAAPEEGTWKARLAKIKQIS